MENKRMYRILRILGILWIIFPDLIPGPIDDLAVLLFELWPMIEPRLSKNDYYE